MPDSYKATPQYSDTCAGLQKLNILNLTCNAQYGEMYNIHINYTAYNNVPQTLLHDNNTHVLLDTKRAQALSATILHVDHAEYSVCMRVDDDIGNTLDLESGMLERSMDLSVLDSLPYNIQQILLYATSGDIQHMRNIVLRASPIYQQSNELVSQRIAMLAPQQFRCIQDSIGIPRAIVPKELVNTTVTLHDFNLVRLHFNSDCEEFCASVQVFHKKLYINNVYDLDRYDYADTAICRLKPTEEHSIPLHKYGTHIMYNSVCEPFVGINNSLPRNKVLDEQDESISVKLAQQIQDTKVTMVPLILFVASSALLLLSVCYAQIRQYVAYKRGVHKNANKSIQEL